MKFIPLSFLRDRASSLWMGLLFIVMLIVLGCGALFAEESPPERPADRASSQWDADLSAADCIGDVNEEVYIPIPVASTGNPEQDRENTDDALNPEKDTESEPQEEEEETPEPEAADNTPQTEQKPTSVDQATKDHPISPGNGGTAGGNTENGNTTSTEYFTTSIKDGETVTSNPYSFSIRHKDPELKVKDLQVFVNGRLIPQFKGDVDLTEGKNTIRVKVDYADDSGKIVASPYKDYTVYLDTQSLVIHTSLSDQTVDRDLLSFTASASYLGESTAVTVTLNGQKTEGSGDRYRVRLKDGANTIVLSAEINGLRKEETYTVTYVNSGIFDFETDLVDGMTVSESSFSFSVWMVNSQNAKISVRLNGGKTVQSDNGTFTVALAYGENTIAVTAKDGDQKVSRSYKVYLERQHATADHPIPDPEHAPTLQCNLTDGMTVNNSKYTVDLIAKDYQGKRLRSSNITVKLNGSPVRLEGENEKTTYLLQLYTPENVVTVYIKDNEGYDALYTFHLNYQKTDGPIGYVTVSVEATTLGLGYLVPPTQVEIYDGEPAAYVVKRFFDRCGITFDYKGTLDEGFYLARINRENLVPDYHIPENLLRYLEEDGASETGIWYTDSLGEFDFYGKSGWNIAVDEFYPNSGLSGVHLNDGQRLAIRFTLHLGYDIGGLNGADGEYPEKFIESY